ncbi:MAG: nucleotidyltransferase domain-containing protein [Candidatus Aenigmarchaeota archaeon]|nr:nucleotidyltransferase domain-containing protein [Candidatus Aenigmarchaeota archaeon]
MGKKKTEEITKEVRKFESAIKKNFFVDKIIIFGSAARGEMTRDSDVDIIVVSRRFGLKEHFTITPKLYDEWHLKQKIDYPVDILLFNTKEFGKLKKEVSIVNEALREGIVV